jgi:kumamolisin
VTGEKPVETVWRETITGQTEESGYGESTLFGLPAWQSAAAAASRHKGRMVPDIAAKADVKFGYQLTIGGLHVPGCGTSAAAPLWASLVALLNEELKVPVGHINPLLYDQRSRNGVQAVSPSRTEWAPEVGLGTPRGIALLQALGTKSGQSE